MFNSFVFILICYFSSLSIGSPVDRSVNVKDFFNFHNILINDILEITDVIQRGKNESSVAEDEHGIFEGGPCLVCLVMVKYSMDKFKETSKAKKVLEYAKHGCITFGLEPPKVCKGGVDIFGPEVAAVLSQIKLPPKEFCAMLFPEKCAYYGDAGSSSWEIEMPQRSSEVDSKIKGKKSTVQYVKVLQLSDLHIDLKYQPMNNAECDEPVCCRQPIKASAISRMVPKNWRQVTSKYLGKILPQHFNKTGAAIFDPRGAGVWGDPRNCDLPWWTFEHLLHAVSGRRMPLWDDSNLSKKNFGDFEYIMWTGDAPAHNIWEGSREEILGIFQYISNAIMWYFPNTPVVPVIGNHDSFPSNNFPPNELNFPKNYSVQWLYDNLADMWKPWLNEQAMKTFRKGGFYTIVLRSGIRIIVLNTNYCYKYNWWILLDNQDPEGMLQWMVDVLHQAEQSGEKVHVLGHVPPGRKPDCVQSWNVNYYKIINRFYPIITGQFFGHTHFDEFQIFYNETRNPVSVAYLGPSVTPFSDSNPAFRVYDMNPSSGDIVDHQTYILNLDKVNELYRGVNLDHAYHLADKVQWTLEYTAKDAYNMTSLTPQEWHRVVTDWRVRYFARKQDTPSLLKYVRFYSKNHWNGIDTPDGASDSDKPCTSRKCFEKILCDIAKNIEWKECNLT